MSARRPAVLFLSGREASYMRNRVLLRALSENYEVTVGTPHLGSTPGRTAAGLARFLAHRPAYDLCFAGFYGQPIAAALSRLQSRPILLDAYVSTYDTLCLDRRRFRPGSPAGRLALWLDRYSCRVADRVLTDTWAHAHFFESCIGVPLEKQTAVYVGCDELLFAPQAPAGGAGAASPARPLRVFTYGSFLPLHGTDVIVRAAALLRDEPGIRFVIGGDGRLRRQVERQIAALRVSNVELTGWIPTVELPGWIAGADLCLGGHFSAVPKAGRVIPTKVFQFLAMARPTIVGDGPAAREVMVHGEHAWAVPMNDAEALAAAIQALAADPDLRAHLAEGGRALFLERFTVQSVARQLQAVIGEVLCESAS